MNKTLLITIDVIVVIALLALAVFYWTHPAGQLPHWLPGYKPGDKVAHFKHGLAAVIVAVAVAAYGWFATGPKDGAEKPAAS